MHEDIALLNSIVALANGIVVLINGPLYLQLYS